MTIQNIISNRLFSKEVFWQIVYEWEDIISKEMNLAVKNNFIRLVNMRYIRVVWRDILHRDDNYVPIPSGNSLAFVMSPGLFDGNVCGRRNVIPIIIDFWLSKENEFRDFESRYVGNPGVLITSKEAYEIIRDRCPRLCVYHWPLSLPDHWLEDVATCPKKYDCAVVGRPNGVLNDWMMRYASTHKDFTYVCNQRKPGVPCNYVTSDGSILGNVFRDRDTYRHFLKSVRIGLYSTPSKDGSRLQYKGLAGRGYNQVTPRFLEYLAAGCHVLSRYDRNPDTDYYELDSISPNVDTYEDFEARMDFARAHDIDCENYKNYLSKHITSSRVEALRDILAQI